MQTIDTRNFTEIVKALTYHEQRDLALELMYSTHVTDRTIRYWFSGKIAPDYCKRQAIAKALGKLFGIKTNIKILFYGR